jgi:hypothetical protein
VFLFQGDILFRLFLELICEFTEPFRHQAEFLEMDSRGLETEDMDDIIKLNYVQELKINLYSKLIETILVGNVERVY